MKTSLLTLLFMFTPLLYAQGCIVGQPFKQPRYVCFDGRSLSQGMTGCVWHAKRGCFLSRVPCCAYDATHYGFYPNPHNIGGALARCKEGYPYHLGEMQTH